MFKKLLQKRRLQREEKYIRSLPRYLKVKRIISNQERVVHYDLVKYNISYDEKTKNIYLHSRKNNKVIVINRKELIKDEKKY